MCVIFIMNFPQEHIEKMSDQEFVRHRDALAAQRLEKPKQLTAQSNLYWTEITSQQYHFDRANTEVAYLKTLTKEDVINFYKVTSNIVINMQSLTICCCIFSEHPKGEQSASQKTSRASGEQRRGRSWPPLGSGAIRRRKTTGY